jgi:hypothetical protein
VGIETSVGLRDELTIEPLLTTAGLVATPSCSCARAVQRVDAWTPELRSEGFKNGDVGQQLVLDRFRKGLELGNELRNAGRHPTAAQADYGTETICIEMHIEGGHSDASREVRLEMAGWT